mmetsp:Transcript_125449/g.267845  ORF Transcript_125449/g.267845 Transcript_125449/m.267845 type:complete len:401 (+) Transcript_125449:71-1273(+)
MSRVERAEVESGNGDSPEAVASGRMEGSKWRVQPRGLAILGNKTTVIDGHGFEGLSRGPPPAGGIEAILAGGQSQRLIHQREVDLVAKALEGGDDSSKWIRLLGPTDGITVSRRAGESLHDAVTMKLEATIPGVPVQVAVSQGMNYDRRGEWDKQVHDFHSYDEWGYPGDHKNSLFYFATHTPPLTDRDFLTYMVVAPATDGSGCVTFCRDGNHPAFPVGHKGRIRAEMRGCAAMISRDPDDPCGSSRFVFITKQDIHLAIPNWMITWFFPGELRKYVGNLRKVCGTCYQQLQKEAGPGRYVHLPLSDLFGASVDSDTSEDGDGSMAMAKNTKTVFSEGSTVSGSSSSLPALSSCEEAVAQEPWQVLSPLPENVPFVDVEDVVAPSLPSTTCSLFWCSSR